MMFQQIKKEFISTENEENHVEKNPPLEVILFLFLHFPIHVIYIVIQVQPCI